MLALLAGVTQAVLLSSSNFTLCVGDSACEPRLLVALTVEGGQTAGAEQLDFSLLSAADREDNLYTSAAPLQLRVGKTIPRVLYRLRYLRSFPSQLRERVVETSYPLCSEGLLNSAGQLRLDSTCGYAYAGGSAVPLSGGFCCSCSALSFFTGLSATQSRGRCTAFSARETAHCMQTAGESWSAYEVLDSRVEYSISLELNGTARNGSALLTSLTLSPAERVASTPLFVAKLLGELTPAQTTAALAGLVVLAPDSAQGPLLAVGREALSLDGTGCDRVGSWYAAFQNQPRRCEVAAGSCLGNQIVDMLARDKQAVRTGRAPAYLLSRLGEFSRGSAVGSDAGLESVHAAPFASLVTVEISAEGFAFRTNAGQGRISDAELSAFEAEAAFGELRARVSSLSLFVADFFLSANCTNASLAAPAALLSLSPLASVNKTFLLSATDGEAKTFSCGVALRNERGRLLDAVELRAEIRYRRDATVPQSPGSSDKTGVPPQTKAEALATAGSLVCFAVCPRSLGLACLIVAGCGAQLLVLAAYLLALLAFLAAAALLLCLRRRLCPRPRRGV